MRNNFSCWDRNYSFSCGATRLGDLSPTFVLPYGIFCLRRNALSVSHTPPYRRFRSPSEVHSAFFSPPQFHRLRLSVGEVSENVLLFLIGFLYNNLFKIECQVFFTTFLKIFFGRKNAPFSLLFNNEVFYRLSVAGGLPLVGKGHVVPSTDEFNMFYVFAERKSVSVDTLEGGGKSDIGKPIAVGKGVFTDTQKAFRDNNVTHFFATVKRHFSDLI